jgi:hypothetical protein
MTHLRSLSLFVGLIVATLANCLGSTGIAHAGFVSGNQLYYSCKSNVMVELADCIGFVSAVADFLEMSGLYGKKACIPMTVTRGQLKDIVVHWSDKDPKLRALPGETIAAAAITDAFPCNKK